MPDAHDEIRDLLPLMAAGVLDAAERRAVAAHLRTCDECAREAEQWGALAEALRLEPTAAPANLAQRTLARVRQQAGSDAQAAEIWVLPILAIAVSWVAFGLLWLLLQHLLMTWSGAGTALSSLSGYAAATLLSWTTAGVAALLLGRHSKKGELL